MRAWVLEIDLRHACMGIRNRRTYINIYISRDSIDIASRSLRSLANYVILHLFYIPMPPGSV